MLKQRVDEAKISPQYLIVVGDPGSMPFVPTGLQQNFSDTVSFDIYRDYRINQYGSNYSQVAMGRIIGLSVYDASQMVARTLAYDRLQGAWKDNALTIPSAPLSWPQSAHNHKHQGLPGAGGVQGEGTALGGGDLSDGLLPHEQRPEYSGL